MKFASKYRPELAASDDTTRDHLCHVELDVAGKRMIATDGHRLVVVACEPDADDVSGPVTEDALKAARKLAGRSQGDAFLHANGTLVTYGGPTFPRPSRETPFPTVDRVVPKGMNEGDKGTHTFRVNARYIAEIAKAMGTENIAITVKTRDALAPIMVRPCGDDAAFALVMPVRK